MNYTTGLENAPPQGFQRPQFSAAPPHRQYGSSYMDLMRAYGDSNASEQDVNSQKMATDYALRQRAAEQQLALQGLQQMATEQQNQNSLATQRFSNAAGLFNSILSGLFN